MPLQTNAALGLMWSSGSLNVVVIGSNIFFITCSFILNIAVLLFLHAGKIRLSDIATITVFTNALADLFAIPVFIATDLCLPAYAISALPFMCKFRLYVHCVTYGGNSLILAALLFSHRNRLYTQTFGKAPCGIFIFPALVWFLSFSYNIWTLVLYECRITGYVISMKSTVELYSNRSNYLLMPTTLTQSSIFVAISFLQTESLSVQRCLFAHSLLTVLVPLGLCLVFLSRTRKPHVIAPSRRLRLGICLLIVNIIFVCPKLLVRLISIIIGGGEILTSEALVIAEVLTRSLYYLHLALKPIIYFIFHPDIKLATIIVWRQRGFAISGHAVRRPRPRPPHTIAVEAPSSTDGGSTGGSDRRRSNRRRWTGLSVDIDFDSVTSAFVVPNSSVNAGMLLPITKAQRSASDVIDLSPMSAVS